MVRFKRKNGTRFKRKKSKTKAFQCGHRGFGRHCAQCQRLLDSPNRVKENDEM